jgi:hypothetical protein
VALESGDISISASSGWWSVRRKRHGRCLPKAFVRDQRGREQQFRWLAGKQTSPPSHDSRSNSPPTEARETRGQGREIGRDTEMFFMWPREMRRKENSTAFTAVCDTKPRDTVIENVVFVKQKF